MHKDPDRDIGRGMALPLVWPDAGKENLLASASTKGVDEVDDARAAAASALACAAVKASANAVLPDDELDDVEMDLGLLTFSSGASTNKALLLSDVDTDHLRVCRCWEPGDVFKGGSTCSEDLGERVECLAANFPEEACSMILDESG